MEIKSLEAQNGSLRCGIIMPISEIDGCSENHWRDIKNILVDAIKSVGFEAELVSEADDVGIIQKRIIQNIYDNPIIVCDVSGKNPNVMFELGLRLAFDKPTIIIKDDCTNYSFDTSPIEHLTYPRDLRYTRILEFKEKLALKIKGTYEKSCSDPNYTTFLKNFGEFKLPKLDTKEVSKDEYIIEELKQLKNELISFKRRQNQLIHSDRVIYRNEELLEDIEDLIRKEIILYREKNENIEINELTHYIFSKTPIKELSLKSGLSMSTITKMIKMACESLSNDIIRVI